MTKSVKQLWKIEGVGPLTASAAVALANKNARIIWAILSSGECYRKSPITGRC